MAAQSGNDASDSATPASATATSKAEAGLGERRSPRRVWAVTIVVLIVIYLLSILAFAQSGRTDLESNTVEVENGVNIDISLIGVNTSKGEMTLRTIGLPAGDYLDSTTNTWAKSIRITTPLGVRSLARDISAGSPIGGTEDITFLIDGDPLLYPFDTYEYGFVADEDDEVGTGPIAEPAPLIEIQQLEDDGSVGDPVPIGFDNPDGLQGWSERWVLESEQGTLSAFVSAKRSGGVLAFVLVVLVLMLLVAALASVVARSVALRRRPIEATMAGWFAALLFALIPLRTNLPDSPPIGAWMDVLVFYWVEIALMLAMSVFIVSWLRFRKPPANVE